MTENEKLKSICDKIGYESKFEYQIYDGMFDDFTGYGDYNKGTGQTRMVDVREIIFTPPFMDAYIDYCMINYCDLDMVAEGKSDIENQVKIGLMNNLDNPVDFLDKLING